MQHAVIEVIIPVYKPGSSFQKLISKLLEQEMPPENRSSSGNGSRIFIEENRA